MNKEFWEKHYKKHKLTKPSSFAVWANEIMDGDIIDIGCGDGRDLYYFRSHGKRAHGVDASNEDVGIIKQDIVSYIKENKSPENVYARFFWHAIMREEQLTILDWVKKRILIEARTKKDAPKDIIGSHKRNLVSVRTLKKDLKERGFTIEFEEEGTGLSPYKGEDPHLIRIVACR
jgi:SAM-dependent methyltransferase